MNGFELHGINHLSPSSLNSYALQPALWVTERLLGRRFVTSAAAERGKAVEHGVECGLRGGKDDDACVAAAHAAFDRATALNGDPKRANERAQIEGYVRHALAELRRYGTPTAYQERIEARLDDVPVPLVGFIDWTFDQYGLLIDLKTSEKHPARISDAHGRQGAIYTRAKHNHSIRFAYAKPTPTRATGRAVVVYELTADEARQHLEALRQIALRLERFLRLSKDPHELAGLVVPDFDHWAWSNPATRTNGREIFGW